MMTSLLSGWLVALLLGVRHASEPDHWVAVSTLMAEPKGRYRSAPLGAWWGLGHAVSLISVGGGLLLMHLRMPPRIGDLLELGVAVMLLILGAASVRRAVRLGRGGEVRRARDGLAVTLPSEPKHQGWWTTARAPLLVGLVHGLAGSGALTVLALASMPSFTAGLVYILLFGAGSILGMVLFTALAERPLRRLGGRHGIEAVLGALAGATSLILGVQWGWPLVVRLVGT